MWQMFWKCIQTNKIRNYVATKHNSGRYYYKPFFCCCWIRLNRQGCDNQVQSKPKFVLVQCHQCESGFVSSDSLPVWIFWAETKKTFPNILIHQVLKSRCVLCGGKPIRLFLQAALKRLFCSMLICFNISFGKFKRAQSPVTDNWHKANGWKKDVWL